MPSGRPTPARMILGESWVVEGEDESPEYSPKDDDEFQKTPPRRPTRGANRSPEPEFVMPPLDSSTLEASYADTTSRSTRFGKESRSSERESRRRNPRNASPEKRVRKKSTADKLHRGAHLQRHLAGTSAPRSQEESSAAQEILQVLADQAATMLSWSLEVLGGALRVLKTPISYLLAIWLLFGIGVIVRTLVTNSVYASLSPACRIPGVSLLNLPFCPAYRVDTSHGDPPPVEFDTLMKVQGKFEEVLEDTAGNVALPMDMKRGEASIRDLRQIVRYSQLHSK